MVPCKYFTTITGCGRGEVCRYSHETDSTAAALPSMDRLDLNIENQRPSQLLRPQSQALIACKFFAKGLCQKGDGCPFSHELKMSASSGMPTRNDISNELNVHSTSQLVNPVEVINTPQSISPHAISIEPSTSLAVVPRVIKNYDNTPADMITRVLSGGMATFGDGAKVYKLSVASDFTTIKITGLPQDTNLRFIETMLAALGIEVPGICIRITGLGTPLSVSAYLRIERPMIGPALSEQLESDWRETEMYAQLKATPVPTYFFSTSDTSRGVNCCKVACSWYRPSKLALLKFADKNIAKAVCRNFNQGHYRVAGKVLTCDQPIVSDRRYDCNYKFLCMLKNIPILADKSDIIGAIDERYRPNEVAIGKKIYEASEEETRDYVKALCSAIGPLASWDPVQDTASKRIKVRVGFQHDPDAREAIMQLNDKHIEILGKGKLMVQQIISVKFKVTTKVYLILQSQIEAYRKIWVEQRIFLGLYHSTDLAQRFISLKIEGDYGDDFKHAKEDLEKLLSGIVAMAGDKPIWNDHFMQPAGLNKIKQIEKDFEVIIDRDRVGQRLRLYGLARATEKAQYTLDSMVKSGLVGYSIALNTQNYLWLSIGGFRQIVSALGKDVASIDTLSTPRRLLIEGGPDEYNTAMAILETKSIVTRSGEAIEEEDDCSICWCPAESPLRTRCGHLYCSQCFENLCSSKATGDTEVSICCEAYECQVVLSLQEIQENLNSAAFEGILEGSFTSYVRRHPNEFHYCPAPDCRNIYRVNLPIKSRICTICLTEICVSCHLSHTGQTCAEYKYQASGGQAAFERHILMEGYKRCPRCYAIILKNGGCSHMICGSCKIHICWICFGTFSTAPQCYEHMYAIHGGIMGPEDYEEDVVDDGMAFNAAELAEIEAIGW
ncbi:hypothetical protein MFRU_009g02370 [Monilinia fructicola]|nr:hypothetical protein MFRU_009g02370 [Monilinia fructicola]